LVQAREMDDAGRAEFLDRFSEQNHQTLVGFAVMGGIFGEGIDLVGERLSGAIIVGVGLPAICPERDLIRNYFDERGTGFDFAYRYPGINRVLQAAGRVIRTDQDRGALLLVDQRFCRSWLPAPAAGSLVNLGGRIRTADGCPARTVLVGCFHEPVNHRND
jgi:DNA excision repair protein ERCC-2